MLSGNSSTSVHLHYNGDEPDLWQEFEGKTAVEIKRAFRYAQEMGVRFEAVSYEKIRGGCVFKTPLKPPDSMQNCLVREMGCAKGKASSINVNDKTWTAQRNFQ